MLGIMRKNAQGLLQYMKRKKLYTTLDSSTVQFTMDKIRGEVMSYATKPDCILKRVSAGDMEAFSLAVSVFYSRFLCKEVFFCNLVILGLSVLLLSSNELR